MWPPRFPHDVLQLFRRPRHLDTLLDVVDNAAAVDLAAWAALAARRVPDAAMSDRAWHEYMARWPDGVLVNFPFDGAEFWYDTFDEPTGRESRTVAGWTRVPASVRVRDVSRQRGFPLPRSLEERGFERGHLIARASGGGLDVNLFPQAWQVNRGHGVEGREFRRLERLAAASPGALQMTRVLWADETNVPSHIHMVVVAEGREVQQGVFGNAPEPKEFGRRHPDTDRLCAGVAFHRKVQTDFVAGLVGASATPESFVRLHAGRTGRVDLLVVPVGAERMAVVVEVKNTDWDALRAQRVRPNIRAHIRQLQTYLDVAVARIGEPEGWQSVAGVLLYPRRPVDASIAAIVTTSVESEALMIVWHDETSWV